MRSKIIWQGQQWQVRESGHLEEIDRGQKLPATRFSPSQLIEEASLPEQMAGKSWINLEDFLAAYRKALAAAGLTAPDIDVIENRAREAATSIEPVPDLMHSPQDD
jgi:hypothetical protein